MIAVGLTKDATWPARADFSWWKDAGVWVLTILFCGIIIPILIYGNSETIYSFDQNKYHLPAVRQIEAKWPRLNLEEDSLSAIAPGYHYALATVGKLIGVGELRLRVINMFVGLGVVLLTYRFARLYLPARYSLWLVMPLASSNFVVKSSAWLVTDNVGLLLLVATLGSLFRGTNGAADWRTGFMAAASTMVRQLNVWLAGPLFAKSIFQKTSTAGGVQQGFCLKFRLLSTLPSLLPFAVLAVLYVAWGGLVPLQWRDASLKVSACPIAYLLSVFGCLGIFYFPEFLHPGRWRELSQNRLLVFFAGAGLLFATLSPTSYSPASGRWGGYLWTAACYIPSILDRSILFVVAAPFGAALIGAILCRILDARGRTCALLWMAALISWASTFVINRQVFHRYFEPTTLVLLVFACSLSRKREVEGDQRGFGALRILSAFQLLVMIVGVSEAFGSSWVAGYRR